MEQTHIARRRAEYQPRVADLDHRNAFLAAERRAADGLHEPAAIARLQPKAAREPGAGGLKVIEQAPGSYVKVRLA